MKRFEEKVAVITGGASGIGAAITDRLIQEGAKGIVVVGRNPDTNENVKHKYGDKVRVVCGDVRDRTTHQLAVGAATEVYGKIDVYVPNAALGIVSPYEALEEADFDAVLDCDYKAVVFGAQATIPHMNDGGSIVLISSIAGLKGMAGMAAYSGAKAAIRQLARTLAAEFAHRNIRTNVLSPGAVETPAWGKLGPTREDFGESMKPMIEATPLNRTALPSEMAAVVAFLASDDASFITGEQIVADGGLTRV